MKKGFARPSYISVLPRQPSRFLKVSIAIVLFVLIGMNVANADEAVLWNTFDSDQAILSSEIGPGGKIVGSAYAYEHAGFGNGYVRKATGDNYVAFPASLVDLLTHRGTMELWITPKVPNPVAYDSGIFGLIGAPYGWAFLPTDVGKDAIFLVWGDGVTGQGFYGGVNFDGTQVYTDPESVQFSATPGVPVHAALSWDINGIDGTEDTIRTYRDGNIVGRTKDAWNPSGQNRNMIITGYGPDSNGFDKFIVDNLIIYDFAKSDFSDRFQESPPDTVQAPSIHCPGDVNGSGTADLLVLTAKGDVVIKELDGYLVNQFSVGGLGVYSDAELMPDTSGNGAPELLVMAGSTVQTRDLLTGAVLGSVAFDGDLAPVDLELITDQTGDGIPELAALGPDPMTVEIRDGSMGALINDVRFTHYVTGKELLVYPDIDGNGAPELAVLADNRRDGADKVEIRDLVTGETSREIWLAKGWQVLEQVLIADLNGNGSEEVAVLRVHPSGNVNVQIRDTLTRVRVNFVGFAVKYPPQELVAVADVNGNGADELVVFGRRFDGRNQKAVIKDSSTGNKLRDLWFDSDYPGQDFVACGDVNRNGSIDLALLGRRSSDGALIAIIKDSKTGERLARVPF